MFGCCKEKRVNGRVVVVLRLRARDKTRCMRGFFGSSQLMKQVAYIVPRQRYPERQSRLEGHEKKKRYNGLVVGVHMKIITWVFRATFYVRVIGINQ